jgi:hypothetical protein
MDLVGRSSLSLTSPLHYYAPLTSLTLNLLLSSLPHSYPSATIPAPNPHSFLPPSYSPSVPTYLPVRERRERERERERELMREGDHLLHSVVGGCTALISHTAHLPVPPSLPDCRIPAPPLLPQRSFTPPRGTLSVDPESSRISPFLGDLEFRAKPRT